MVLVRLVFQTQWGKAHEVVEAFKEGRALAQSIFGEGVGQPRILTDLSGPFHTVVQEYEVESLAAWEANRGRVFSHPEFQKSQERLAGLIESGRAEFYTVEV